MAYDSIIILTTQTQECIFMWRNIKMLYNRVPEPFATLQASSLHSNLRNALANKFYFTPKLQKLPFTNELAKYVRYIDRKDKIKVSDMRSLVEAILTEYGTIHRLENHPKFKDNLDYSISRNFVFQPNELSSYFGEVDYMVWLNREHFVPVLFNQKQINQTAGMALAHATMGLKCIARKDLRNSGYSIVTTGQEWQMFKVYNTLKAEKTVIFEGRNMFKSITKDFQMIEVILGLLDECLETEREEVNLLKLAYDVIDEGRNMIEASTVEEANKGSPMSKILKKFYEKKRDETSK